MYSAQWNKCDNVMRKEIHKTGKYKGLRTCYSDDTKDYLLTVLRDRLCIVHDHYKAQSCKKFNNLVTINFDNAVSSEYLRSAEKLIMLVKSLKGLIDLKWVNHLKFVLEQRSEDPNDLHGLHVHILINMNSKLRKSLVIRSIYNRYNTKKITSQLGVILSNKNSVDVKACHGKSNYDAVLDYLLQNKEDSKLKRVDCDLQFRKRFELEDIYEVSKDNN